MSDERDQEGRRRRYRKRRSVYEPAGARARTRFTIDPPSQTLLTGFSGGWLGGKSYSS